VTTSSGARGTVRNALLGCAVAGVFLFVLAVVANYALLAAQWGKRPDRGYPKGYFTRDALGMVKPAPGRWHVVTKSSATGQVVYDVNYTVDQFGRRITPLSAPGPRDRFALFFGCSYTYGEGLNDDETLPHYFGELAPRYRPYNYAFHGGGPFEALARMESVDFKTEVAEKQGIGFYTFIDDHVNRVNNSSSVASWHSEEIHYSRLPDGTFVHDGSFNTARPWQSRLYRFVYGNRLLRYLGFHLPLRITSHELDLTAAAIAEVANRFHRHFPDSDFYVVFYPNTAWHDRIGKRLVRMGVRTLDYHDLFDKYRSPYLIEGDGHPSAEAIRTFASAIVRDLHVDAAAQPQLTADAHAVAAGTE
jgi:hypothetical protein